MNAYDEFANHVHSALKHLYEPDRLRQNPLAALFGVANRPDTFAALQRILTEAIQSLEPKADEPPQSYGWEVYEPLFYRYVHQLGQEHVAKQLGMSVRHLRRKEHAALEVLASQLWKQFDLQGQLVTDNVGGATSPEGAESSPTVNDELAWLKDTPPGGPVDLNQTLPEVVQLLERLAAQHGVYLKMATMEALPALAVHEVALRQALLNLLGVAIHWASGGKVFISARPLPLGVERIETCLVEIRIGGVRSPSTAQAISNTDVPSLELARQLAGLCGGRLAVSDSQDTFDALLTLPSFEQLPVLVIDDNADTLQLLQRYTAGSRYRLIATRDPERALELAERFSPRIIVLDVMMPSVDGWRVLAYLRQQALTERIPIVVCTILAQEELAFSLGASGFLQKPVTRQGFLAALDRQIEPMEKGSH